MIVEHRIVVQLRMVGAGCGFMAIVGCGSVPTDDSATKVDSGTSDPSDVLPMPVIVPLDPTESSVLTASLPTKVGTGAVVWQWYVDEVEIVGANTDSLTGDDFGRDDQVTVSGTPDSGQWADLLLMSDPVTILNTAPSTDVPVIEPAEVVVDTPATCVPGTSEDIDEDDVFAHFRWWNNGQELTETTDVLQAAEFVLGDSLVCGVTPDDGTELGNERLSTSYEVGGDLLYALEVQEQDPMMYWRFDEVMEGEITEWWDSNGVGVEPDSFAKFAGLPGLSASPALRPVDGFDGFETTNTWFGFEDPIAVVTPFFDQDGWFRNDYGSISFWFLTERDAGTLFVGTAESGERFIIDVYKGKIRVRNGGISVLPVIQPDLTTDVEYHDAMWHHLVVTWEETGNITIYVDGGEGVSGETKSQLYSGEVFKFFSNMFGKGSDDEEPFSGLADELAVWNRALTMDEVELQYQSAGL